MSRTKINLFPSILLCAVLFATTVGRADEEPVATQITLHPVDEPKPALKYRLLPPFLETTPGNAAVYYGKVNAERSAYFSNEELWDNMQQWREMPLEDLRRLIELRGDEISVQADGSISDFLTRGARCRNCDWQLPIGDVPFYDILLPQVQMMRQFGRILDTKARLEIARGEFDKAIATLQNGYALGRHVATGETLVNGLVGLAICGLMGEQLREHVQQPGAPNLYWALTDLPRPLTDMRRAFEVETWGVGGNFPEIDDFSSAEIHDNAWLKMLFTIASSTDMWFSLGEGSKPPSWVKLIQRCKQLRPMAEQALVESGFSEERVEAMSVRQVAVLYMVTHDRLLLEQAIKYVSLPYPEAIAGIDAAIEQAKREPHIIPFAPSTLSGIRNVRMAIARLDREIAVLRLLEALRIHGARHQGQLPRRLEDITSVPVPIDPVTGQAFVYARDGEKATLQGPTLRETPLNYVITMVGSPE